jgi:tetratricopeptide (TPR) repeat protein
MSLRWILAPVLLAWLAPAGAAQMTPAKPAGPVVADAKSAAEFQAFLDQAVASRRRATGEDEVHALIAVRREVAATLAERGAWAEAISQLHLAVMLAESLEDSGLLISLHRTLAGYFQSGGNAELGLQSVDSLDRLIAPLNRTDLRIEAGLLRAGLLSDLGRRAELEKIYPLLLALPGADVLRIERHRAMRTRPDPLPELRARWIRVLELARGRGDRTVEAAALDQLGRADAFDKEPRKALELFSAAEAVGVPLERNFELWQYVIESCSAVDDRARARRAIGQAMALVDPARDPARAATLHQASGELLARDGQFEAAYGELARANELNRKSNATRQFMPFVRIMAPNLPTQAKAAAELAASRNALRDAELERTRLRQRQTAGLATVALLVTALLGLAYLYKRRAAAALADQRAAAELRAERTHWQMLRYQLSPHFLFNALSSLSGLVVSDPAAARHVVDRLSEFCQLALEGAKDGLRTVAHELKLVRAYLDVEQAGHGDGLRVAIDVAPEAEARLLPPLLLQPLVENALKYGSQTSPDLLELRVAVGLDGPGDDLLIEIANTGRWIEPGTVPQRRTPVGLTNVRQRLVQVGAAPEALTIAQDPGWVRLRLRLPHLAASPPAVAT